MGALHSLRCRAVCASPVSLLSVPMRGWLLSSLGRQGLGWSPVSSFLVICSPSGDTRGPSVIFEAVDMPCSGTFHFCHIADYIYDFCPLPDPDVAISILVFDVEHTSFHFGLCGRKFELCLFGQCPCLCTICNSRQHIGVINLSLQGR